jgi:hypothetical protein
MEIKFIINVMMFLDGLIPFLAKFIPIGLLLTWVYITNFTFGSTVYLLKKLLSMKNYRQRNKLNFRILNEYIRKILESNRKIKLIIKNLDYLVEFRNYTGHNIPLSIFITSGNTKNDRYKRIDLLKQVAIESDSRQSVQDYIENLQEAATKYVNIRF